MLGETIFKIKGLNVEKSLNILAKDYPVFEVERIEKNLTKFKVGYRDRKKVKKTLKNLGYEIIEEKNVGFLPFFCKIFGNFGVVFAILLATVLYFIQSSYIWQFEILGQEKLNESEIVAFINNNFSRNKNEIDLSQMENSLYQNFEEISFVSCIIKGQTLVVNIKEKLMPDEIYGDFEAIYSQYDGKVSKINIISGTAVVSVGDYVSVGDVLVEPYYLDSSGVYQPVKAEAEITLEVYHTAETTHFETRLEIVRTGRSQVVDEIQLFGLTIYKNGEEPNFANFEIEEVYEDLTAGNLLPFKLKRTIYYELEEIWINESFENVKNELISSTREKVLENCQNYDKIIDEFYTLNHFTNGTIISYVIVEEIVQTS